jgi:hypothetical protein
MRKLFRMAYESCSGQCYAYSDVMRIHTLGLDIKGAAEFLRRLLAMHAPSCGNPNIQFRLDHDEDLGIFVASMHRYGQLDLFAGKTPLEAMNKLIDGALAYYTTTDFKANRREDLDHGVIRADRAGVCHHGTDDKLINFAIEFSGLDAAGRAELRAQFA